MTGQLASGVSVADDDVWVADSTPGGVWSVSRDGQTLRSGWVGRYGYCVSYSRYFWGLRLHLVATLHGLALGWALTGAKADERVICWELLNTTPPRPCPSPAIPPRH